ncbi:hypothetical protein V5799_000111 [Amblyomma americanum]|uniref:Uncharacterized protein n=1 Tax=Amblyomma americanum TaxID=6943 RepID=A0AAQ4D401_AMBAM
MEYAPEKSILGEPYQTAEIGAEENEQRCTKALIVAVFFVLALLSAIAWVMIITVVLDKNRDGLETSDDDFSRASTGKDRERRTAPVVIPEVVEVPRITSTPRRHSPTPSSATSGTLAPVTFPTPSSALPTTFSPPRPPPPSGTTARTTTSTEPQTTRTTVTTSTTTSPQKPLSQALFCTYGTSTNAKTKFPRDGLCHYIFYDSMYKDGNNMLSQGPPYSADLEAVLKQVQSGRYKNTQFGLGFAFAYLPYLLQYSDDRLPAVLDPLTQRGVSHLGVIDCSVYGLQPQDVYRMFRAIEQLNNYLKRLRSVGKAAYSVMGAISFNSSWNKYFTDNFRGNIASRPNLFISHGFQMSADWHRTPCLSTPPTVLTKPPHPQHNIHDLRDAVGALAEVSAATETPAPFLSVTMKGRWTELLSDTPKAFAQCSDQSPRPYGTYVSICNAEPFSNKIEYDKDGYVMRAYDSNSRLMFLYDNERALCEKLCKVKANYTQLMFGLAVFDLEYEDGDNVCSTLNRFTRFSRLQMVEWLLEFFSSQYTDATQEKTCSELWRPKRG